MSLTIQELCPKCGANMYTYTNQGNSTTGEYVIKTVCSHCGYEKPDLGYMTYSNPAYGFAIGSANFNPYKNITIEADTLKLHQKGVDITIDISNEILRNIENIEINGFKFVKEVCI